MCARSRESSAWAATRNAGDASEWHPPGLNGSFHANTGCQIILSATEMEETMISGGNVTVFVTNMDRAVRFYTETLGLKLAYRFGDHWASVEAGRGLTIGLHPSSE